MTIADEDLPQASDAVSCGPVWVSPNEYCEVRVRGRPVRLSVGSIRVLACLLRVQGRIMTRDELWHEATGRRGMLSASRAVDVRILRIRRALGSLGRYLLTVPTRGYRIDAAGLARAR
ncbi:MAG: winged helix-turn-helix domain-containing protein [Actinomycetota bacterium]